LSGAGIDPHALLAAIVESSDDAVIGLASDGTILSWNHAAESLFGYPASEALGRPVSVTVGSVTVGDEALEGELGSLLDRIRRGEHVRHYETVRTRRNGERRDVSITLSPIYDADGAVVGASKIVRDVTSRKRAEAALRRNEERSRTFFDASAVPMAQADPQTRRLVRVNDAFARLTGYSREELVGKPIAELDHPDDREADEAAFRGTVDGGGTSYDIKKRYVRKDGRVIWVRAVGTVQRDETGRPALAAGVVLDVTAQHRADERLQESEQRFRALVDQSPFSVQLFSPDGRTVRVNRAWERLWGVRPDQIADYNVLEDPQLEAKGVLPHLRRAFAGEPAALPEIAYDPEETVPGRTRHEQPVRWVSAVAYPLKGEGGTVREVALIHEDVTARRLAEQALRERADTLSGILAASVDHIYVVGRGGRYLHVSDGGAKVLGLRPDEMTGRTWRDLGLPASVMEPFDAVRDRALRAGEPVREEVVFRTPAGEDRWYEYVVAPLRTADGEADAVVVVSRDVTDRERAESELRRSEELLRAVVESTPECVKLVAADGSLLHMNAAGLRMIEADDLERVAGACVYDLIAPEFRKAWTEFNARICGGSRETFEFDLIGLKGARRHMETTAVPVHMPDGTTAHLAVTRDVTDRKRRDDEIARLTAESDRRRRLYETILSNTPDLAYVWGLDHRFVYVNEGLLRMWGKSWDEAIGKNCLELGYEPWHAAMHDREIDQVVATKQPIRGEVPFTGTFGRRIYEYILVPVIGAGGEVEAVAGTTRDVTDRKRAEADARFLADASAALADVSDPDRTLQTVARLAVPHFADWCAIDMLESGSLRRVAVAHVDPAKVELARELHRRFPPDPAAPQGVWNIARTGASEVISEIDDRLLEATVPDPELLRSLRELGLRSYIGVPLKARDAVLGVVTFIAAESGRRYDQSDLALAEDLARRAAVAVENARLYAELRQADRRKDEFLAMLAHELRNPLAPIRSGLDLLRLEGAAPEVTDAMSAQVGHVVRLVDDLLDVSRILRGKVELKKAPTELADVIRRAVEAVRPQIEEHRQTLDVSLPADPVRLDADPVRLTQVVTNLLHNAGKYTEQGGSIRLDARREAGEVVIRVTDTGIGIAADLLPRVFDLFTQADQTLARSQGGLGIGLTVVKSLVEMHGGTVSAQSRGPGQGSEFTVRLPIGEAPAAAEQEAPMSTPAPAARILVVDDNAPGAKLLARLLEKLGNYEIAVAHDGEDGIAAAQSFRPDLILLDIGLPKLDGYEVARRLRDRPEFRDTLLVALTGYGTAEDRRRSVQAGFDDHLVKPPSLDTLRHTLAHPRLTRARRRD
jgi:PAS domain S-box-containing protein